MEKQEYYFKISDYKEIRDIFTYSGEIKTKKLKKYAEKKALEIAKKIAYSVYKITHFKREIYIYWTTRNTFGFIFTDFVKSEERRNVIGKGRKHLFEKIKDEYFCVILSKRLPHNFRTFKIEDGKKCLIININYFRRFSQIIRYENFVSLFLYKFDNEEVARIIRSWITDSPEKSKKILDENQITITEIAGILENFEINSLEELSNFLEISTNIIRSRIEEKYNLFLERLEEFKELIDKEKTIEKSKIKKREMLENEIRDFLRRNPWIIDFIYDEKSVDLKTHKDADIVVVDSYLKLKRLLILEIKLPTYETIKQYRKKDAIRSIISNAISQLIHYMIEIDEKTKENGEKIILEGYIVVGRDKKEFIPIINKFLHGITIKTYYELYEDAKKRLHSFAKGPLLNRESK